MAAALEQLVPNSDHRLELILLLTGNPDKEAVAAGAPEQVCLVNAIAYGADEAESRALLATVANSALNDAPLAKKEYEPTNLKILTGETGESFPHGRMATEGVWSNSIAPVIAILSERMRQAVTPLTTISIRFMGNTRLPENAAYSLIGSTNILSVLTWRDARDDSAVAGWLRATMSALEPFPWGITSTMRISSVIRKGTSIHSRPTAGQDSGLYASVMIRPGYSTTTMACEISATASSFRHTPE